MTEEEVKNKAEKELIYTENALYLFDFDGTIYPKDSMIEFLKMHVGTTKFYLTLPFMTIPTVKYFIHKNKTRWKADFLKLFIKGHSRQFLSESAVAFAKTYQSFIYQPAIDFINKIKTQNTVCIVSASLDIWLNPLLQNMDVDIICTHAEFIDEQFSGIIGKNCNAEEKVNQLKMMYDLSKFDKIISFGNSNGDYSMYKISDHYYHNYFS